LNPGINAAGVYLIMADDAFLGAEYPFVQIICYVSLYVNSVIMVFGYRVWEINGVIKLATLFGKKVTLNVDEIRSVLSFLGYVFVLKSDIGNFIVWSNLRIDDRKRLLLIAKKNANKNGSE
jgi:hypothetical protein